MSRQLDIFLKMKLGVYQADALQLLESIPDKAIDLFATDFPYESLEEHRAKGTTTRLVKEWFDTIPNEQFPKILREMYRTAARNSHLYLICDHVTAFVMKPMVEAAGWKYWNLITWDKEKLGMGYHYRHRKEFVIFAEKGKRLINDLSIPDIIRVPAIRGGYPTEKPVGLMKILISQSTDPGEIVCDPFMGSGSTLVAAADLERKWLGCDISTKAFNKTILRLEGREP